MPTFFLRSLAIPLLAGGMVFGLNLFSKQSASQLVPPVFAEEEEEDEYEEEDDGENTPTSETSQKSTSTKTKTEIIETVEYRPVQRTVVVTEPAFATDTDGDKLVDGLDPNPLVPETEYFTDIDGDGVPNAFDQHHDSDDFVYLDDAEDANRNGLIDEYE